jgi:ribosomal protein S27AE
MTTQAYRNKKAYQARYPERAKAHRAARHAIKTGKLIRQPCERCGEADVHAHHDDYTAPLVVRWLCRLCHRRWHEDHGVPMGHDGGGEWVPRAFVEHGVIRDGMFLWKGKWRPLAGNCADENVPKALTADRS